MKVHPTVKSLLEEIVENAEKLTLTHSEVIAIGKVLDASVYLAEALSKNPSLDFYINSMMMYGLPHKQRSFFAKRALRVIEVYEEKSVRSRQ